MKELSIRFGIGLVYYINSVQVPEPPELALSAQEEEDGIEPEEWTRRLISWSEANGITHIYDDNTAEDSWPNGGTPISLEAFKALVA
jgi:hypothetical protein